MLKLPKLSGTSEVSTLEGDYRSYSLNVDGLGLFELEESVGIDAASFLAGFIFRHYYNDSYELSVLIEDSSDGAGDEDPTVLHEYILNEIDNWSISYLYRFEDIFNWIKYEVPYRVVSVSIRGRNALIELLYKPVDDRLLSSAEEAELIEKEGRW